MQLCVAAATRRADWVVSPDAAKEYFPVHPDQPEGSTLAHNECQWLSTQRSMRVATRTLLARRGDWIGLREVASSADGPASLDDYLGAAMRSSPAKDGTNPVFVSCGHRVGLATALELVLACCTVARVPEPTRMADQISQSGGQPAAARRS